jgi:hypothetical protein
LKNVVRGYEESWGFPNCGGAIDGTHISIIAPSESHGDSCNSICSVIKMPLKRKDDQKRGAAWSDDETRLREQSTCFSFMENSGVHEYTNVVRGYEESWGFPNCGGAIDGTHISIIAPSESHGDYLNRKDYYSLIMQHLTDLHIWLRILYELYCKPLTFLLQINCRSFCILLKRQANTKL